MRSSQSYPPSIYLISLTTLQKLYSPHLHNNLISFKLFKLKSYLLVASHKFSAAQPLNFLSNLILELGPAQFNPFSSEISSFCRDRIIDLYDSQQEGKVPELKTNVMAYSLF